MAFRFGVLLAALCWAAPAAAQTYNNPTINGLPVDHCQYWAQNCGWSGAHAFCRSKGHGAATHFTTYRPGRTYVMGSNRVCEGPPCQGFSQVVCGTGGEAGDPNAYPAGCAYRTPNGEVLPRATMEVKNSHVATFNVSILARPEIGQPGIDLGIVGIGQTRIFAYSLVAGRSVVRIRWPAESALGFPGGIQDIPVVLTNNGPRTCGVVRQIEP